MMASRGMGAIAPSKMPGAKRTARRDNTDFMEDGEMRSRRDNTDFTQYAEGGKVSPAWQRKEGKNPNGGLNAKGRASAKAQGMNLKPPAPHPKTEKDAKRRDSFCARMSGMPGPMKDEKGKPTRKALSLKAWNC